MNLLRRLARAAQLWPSRIGLRLLLFNLLLVFLPVAGVLYLDVYERELLQGQERGMVQQARLLASALGGGAGISPEQATAVLERLGRRGENRLRVYDSAGLLLADSATVSADAPETRRPDDYDRVEPDVRRRILYRLGAWLARARVALVRLTRPMLTPEPESPHPARRTSQLPDEVRAALRGRYGAATRPTPGQRSMTLHSAVPVRTGDRVVGAVVVSQSTYRLLGALYAIRLRVFEIVLASLAVAAFLSALLAKTIVHPLVRLRHAASALGDRLTAMPARFPGSTRRDEIGDLARALEELTHRLDAHVRLLESFAADVSHEFKNPLASIRTAAEMLAETTGPDRQRFATMLVRDVDRLERLVSGVRELARIDAQLSHEALESVDLVHVLTDCAAGVRLTSGCNVVIEVEEPANVCVVRGSAERLAQVFENVLANACSFSPPGAPVTVAIDVADGQCRVIVDDQGPGIPPEHLDRIFDRFFTYRPDVPDARREHAGLGLAIARAILEGYGGAISASNRPEGGAQFDVRLPAFIGARRIAVPADPVPRTSARFSSSSQRSSSS
jgi:two-component system sensor histidine kinase ChvG